MQNRPFVWIIPHCGIEEKSIFLLKTPFDHPSIDIMEKPKLISRQILILYDDISHGRSYKQYLKYRSVDYKKIKKALTVPHCGIIFSPMLL
jgi:hypothetical protein